LFKALAAGRPGEAPMLTKADGAGWRRDHYRRAFVDAQARARVTPACPFHDLRHTYASLLAQAGADLLTISKLLGHADTRVTARHYAHLCDRTLAQAVATLLPGFGGDASKVTAIDGRRSKTRL
jgi:integrase